MVSDPDTIKAAAANIAQVANDVYKDIAQPSARRVGTAIETVAKIALTPFALLDAGYERSRAWLEAKLRARIDETPPECVIAPPNNIAIPAMLGIAMSGDTPELRDLYAELLMKAIDCRQTSKVHPAYIALIEQLCPEEALVFIGLKERSDNTLLADWSSSSPYKPPAPSIEVQFLEHCKSIAVEKPERSQVWLDNLLRLSLVEIRSYSESEISPGEQFAYGERSASVETVASRELVLTAFGRGFLEACAPPKVTV